MKKCIKVLSHVVFSVFCLFLFIPQNVKAETTFNGCKDSPVSLSISCSESDDFSFSCEDECGLTATYSGYSSVSFNGSVSYKKNYKLVFPTSGEHTVTVKKNDVFLETINVTIAEEHTYDDGKITTAAKCNKAGVKTYTCSNCKNTYDEEIPMISHDYRASVTQRATCSKEGVTTYRCWVCGDTYTEPISKVAHTYTTITNKATCTENGATYQECTVCHETTDRQPIAALGHDYHTKTTPATIFKEGKEVKTCSRCGDTITIKLKKLPSSVTLSKKTDKIKVGKTVTLKIKKKTKGDVISKWTTSDKKVATVKNGRVTGRKKGKATITLKMKSGCTAKCVVTVKK